MRLPGSRALAAIDWMLRSASGVSMSAIQGAYEHWFYATLSAPTGESFVAGETYPTTRFASDTTAGTADHTQGTDPAYAAPMDPAYADAGSYEDPAAAWGEVWVLYEDRQGLLWIGLYDGGIVRYDPDANHFTHYWHDPNDARSLSHNRILSLLEDREGRFWVGTDGGGLNHFDPQTGTFTAYRHDPDDPASLSSNFVWDFHADNNNASATITVQAPSAPVVTITSPANNTTLPAPGEIWQAAATRDWPPCQRSMSLPHHRPPMRQRSPDPRR